MIAIDKIKHFVVGYLISMIISAVYPSIAGVITAMVIGFFAGVLWEVMQAVDIVDGFADITDAYATMIGTIAGFLPVLLMIIL